MTPQTGPDRAPPRPERRGPSEIVVSLARQISTLDAGSAAALRRGPLTGPGVAAFWKLLADHEIPESQTDAWASVVQAVAVLTPVGQAVADGTVTSPHEPPRSMGAALHGAGISEMRLARLLGAKGAMRREMLIRICRRLSRDTEHRRFDLRTLALFVVGSNEKTDRRIASEYYRADASAHPRQSQTKEE